MSDFLRLWTPREFTSVVTDHHRGYDYLEHQQNSRRYLSAEVRVNSSRLLYDVGVLCSIFLEATSTVMLEDRFAQLAFDSNLNHLRSQLEQLTRPNLFPKRKAALEQLFMEFSMIYEQMSSALSQARYTSDAAVTRHPINRHVIQSIRRLFSDFISTYNTLLLGFGPRGTRGTGSRSNSSRRNSRSNSSSSGNRRRKIRLV
jgi:hypothetical protein